MMVDLGTLLTIVQTAGSLLIVPLVTALWQMNTRLSNIEGVLHGLEKQYGIGGHK